MTRAKKPFPMHETMAGLEPQRCDASPNTVCPGRYDTAYHGRKFTLDCTIFAVCFIVFRAKR